MRKNGKIKTMNLFFRAYNHTLINFAIVDLRSKLEKCHENGL